MLQGGFGDFLIDLAKTGKEDAEVRAVTFDAGASTGTELKAKTVNLKTSKFCVFLQLQLEPQLSASASLQPSSRGCRAK